MEVVVTPNADAQTNEELLIEGSHSIAAQPPEVRNLRFRSFDLMVEALFRIDVTVYFLVHFHVDPVRTPRKTEHVEFIVPVVGSRQGAHLGTTQGFCVVQNQPSGQLISQFWTTWGIGHAHQSRCVLVLAVKLVAGLEIQLYKEKKFLILEKSC